MCLGLWFGVSLVQNLCMQVWVYGWSIGTNFEFWLGLLERKSFHHLGGLSPLNHLCTKTLFRNVFLISYCSIHIMHMLSVSIQVSSNSDVQSVYEYMCSILRILSVLSCSLRILLIECGMPNSKDSNPRLDDQNYSDDYFDAILLIWVVEFNKKNNFNTTTECQVFPSNQSD